MASAQIKKADLLALCDQALPNGAVRPGVLNQLLRFSLPPACGFTLGRISRELHRAAKAFEVERNDLVVRTGRNIKHCANAECGIDLAVDALTCENCNSPQTDEKAPTYWRIEAGMEHWDVYREEAEKVYAEEVTCPFTLKISAFGDSPVPAELIASLGDIVTED